MIDTLGKNKKVILATKYIMFFMLIFIAGRACLNEAITPFVFGLFFALVWCNQNVIILSIIYVLAGYLSSFSTYILLENSLFCVIFAIIYFVHYKTRKPLKYIHLLIYACLCNIPKIFIEIYFLNSNIVLIFVEFVLGLMYTFACIKIFEGVCVRGVCSRFTSTEIICAMAIFCATFCGLMSFNIGEFYLVKLFGVLTFLTAAYVANITTVMLISISSGLGTFLFLHNPTFLTMFAIWGLTVSAFKTKNKYISCIAVLLVEFLFGLYFNIGTEFSIVSILPTIIACLVYLLIPSKILDSFGNEFQSTLASLTQQSVINRNREMLYHRLVELGDVFAEMNKVYLSMINGGIMGEDERRLILNEIKIKHCKNCPSFGKCYRIGGGETANCLAVMVNLGIKKGKVNLLDVPTEFAGKCEKLNTLVSSINDLINQYKNYAGLMNNIDASKVLLAEQLEGVSEIMKDLSLEVNKGVIFESGKEKKIIDELTYNNIICSDALVFQDREHILSVTLSVRKDDKDKSGICKVVSRVCKQKMEVVDEVSSTRAGWQILTLKSAPKYGIVFGIASKTKTGSVKSGDCYSVIKIKDEKYLFALCDGMGSGEMAQRTSNTAIDLIENFYKAGFDKEIILSSVNKLISLGKNEVFSALDLCVVDTRVGEGDFIKMGAPESFIKHKDTTEQVKIGALPLGIIQNAESKSEQIYFASGDKIILATDGVVDAFGTADRMQDHINNITSTNPQTIADDIISKAVVTCGGIAKDDMSIIVAKIFER